MAGRKRNSQNKHEVNPLSGCAASPFLSRCAREGGRHQRGGAALARCPSLGLRQFLASYPFKPLPMLPRHHEPIVAIATAPGRGGVGIVRISGKGLAPLVEVLCGRGLQPREATYLPFRDAAGQPIDQGLGLYFPAPHSYTGEDVLELQAHGGPVVLQLLLARCLEAATQAHPLPLELLGDLRVGVVLGDLVLRFEIGVDRVDAVVAGVGARAGRAGAI